MPATRQGSRWLHQQPTEDEIKEWFEQQKLHPEMQHGPYMGGIVLIAATEKVKVTKQKQNGDTYVAESDRVVFTPYVKVDTRIAYFRDYVRQLNGGKEHGDFVAVIEPVKVPRITNSESAFYNAHLPDGFSVLAITNNDGSVSRFLVCTQRVAIYERESGPNKRPVLEGTGTKQTAMSKKWADDNAIMKAETGAVGRALGMAGILVVGTGVATAEDMQEALAGPSGPGAASDAATAAELPADAPQAEQAGQAIPADQPQADQGRESSPTDADAELRAEAAKLLKDFEQFPDQRAAYTGWWTERGFGKLSELSGPALKGAFTKLERDLDAAKKEAGVEAPGE